MFANIEAERARKRLTQEEISEILGVTRKTYYSWVMGGKIPSTKLMEMSKLFECSIDYLLGLTEKKQLS